MMKNTPQFIYLYFFIFIAFSSTAQVGINTIEPDASAVLDISSTNRGVLFPRMDLGDLTKAAPVTTPEKSLMVWNTDAANNGKAEGFYYWDGMRWKSFNSNTNTNTESNELSGVFGQLSLNADFNTTLKQNNRTTINAASSSSGSSGVELNQSNSFSITTEVDGTYRVEFTVTYRKRITFGADEIQFYFYENTNPIALANVTGSLERTANTVTYSGNLELKANQYYGIGFFPSGEGLFQELPITILSNETSFSIERQ